jgi:prevent-host-death family protein
MKASVRELKAHLSKYLAAAKAGREVIVTSRGRAVARLSAINEVSDKEPSRAEIRRRLSQIPGIILSTRRGKPGSNKPFQVKPGQKTFSEIVLEDRR